MSQFSEPHDSLGAHLGRVTKLMSTTLIQHLKQQGHEISLEQWIVLVHLWRKDGQNQRWLCEFAGQHKTSITRAIDALETQNIVLRVPDKEDRRNNLIYLTNKGKTLEKDMMPSVIELMGEITDGIPPSDIEVCKSVLRRMFDNLKTHNHI